MEWLGSMAHDNSVDDADEDFYGIGAHAAAADAKPGAPSNVCPKVFTPRARIH
jgi:hypothetical protein